MLPRLSSRPFLLMDVRFGVLRLASLLPRLILLLHDDETWRYEFGLCTTDVCIWFDWSGG